LVVHLREIRALSLALLEETDAIVKANSVRGLAESCRHGKCVLAIQETLTTNGFIPGRPVNPTLVQPRLLQRRAMNTLEGRVALIHALAHIEFNAINLALDAIWRFPNMPEKFYFDWLKVADEEAYHFTLLNAHLQSFGFHYGDFDAHNSLWEMAEKTKDSIIARIALVPRVLEARGLDASPGLRSKLAQAGDDQAAAILDIILRDEIGHVAIGNYWFNWLCKKDQLCPISTFNTICQQYEAPTLKPPFNVEARKQAGFSDLEIAYLTGI
jgi:uncharacterized ferritin-like protein (DUF455 family)